MILTMKNVITKYFERTCLWPQFQYKKMILENKFPNICSLIEQDITMGHLMDLFVLYLHNNMVYITVSTTTWTNKEIKCTTIKPVIPKHCMISYIMYIIWIIFYKHLIIDSIQKCFLRLPTFLVLLFWEILLFNIKWKYCPLEEQYFEPGLLTSIRDWRRLFETPEAIKF